MNTTITENKEKIADELADTFIFLAYLSRDLNIDLEKSILNKLAKNHQKYPVQKSKGNNTKYDKL